MLTPRVSYSKPGVTLLEHDEHNKKQQDVKDEGVINKQVGTESVLAFGNLTSSLSGVEFITYAFGRLANLAD